MSNSVSCTVDSALKKKYENSYPHQACILMRRTGKYNGKMTNNKQSKQVKFILYSLWRAMENNEEGKGMDCW